MSEQALRLENWEVFDNPWKMKRYLRGQVYGHPRHPDGRMVTTSAVIELSREAAVTQSGTTYQLGKQRCQTIDAAKHAQKLLEYTTIGLCGVVGHRLITDSSVK